MSRLWDWSRSGRIVTPHGTWSVNWQCKGVENFDALKKIAHDSVYDESRCENTWTVLCFLIQLLMLKAKYRWSYSSSNDLLRLLGSLLSKPNFVPKNTYEWKKTISPLSMRVQRIYACPNHWMLYCGDYEKYENCPNCFHTCEIHWRNDNIYLLIIQCLVEVNCLRSDCNEN